jgi:outer membrane lipoprotein-sorting protein
MLISTRTWMPAQTDGLCRSLCKIFLIAAFATVGPLQTTALAADSEKTTDSKISSELKQLQIKASKHESFKVKFDQTVFSALRKKTTRSDGELIFSQPRKFRWEIVTPNRELYVNNGEWFWKYVENTKHAVRLPANSGDLEFLDVIFQLDKLSGKYQLEKLTRLTDTEGKQNRDCPKGHTCVGLEPVQKSAQSKVELAIDQTNGFVSVVRIDFRNGNRTLINFNSFKGGKVASDAFEFTPPPGTAVDKR